MALYCCPFTLTDILLAFVHLAPPGLSLTFPMARAPASPLLQPSSSRDPERVSKTRMASRSSDHTHRPACHLLLATLTS